MITSQELKDSNARYIDPTDAQPNIHPQFFELTAEEYAEQERIKVREMSIFNPIDSERAREIIFEFLRDKKYSKSLNIIFDPTDKKRDVWKIADGLNEPPIEKGFWQTAADTVIAEINNHLDTHKWSKEKGYWIPKNQIGKINSGKGKAKADYKAKFYKNTAKQSKPSPMLISLIGKTK